MLWCSHCQCSIPDDAPACPQCGGPLEPALRAEWDFSLKDRPGHHMPQDPVHLVNLPDYALAGMLAELLEDNGIPSYLRESGTLGQASSIYLEASQLQEAKAWVDAFLNAPDDASEAADSESAAD